MDYWHAGLDLNLHQCAANGLANMRGMNCFPAKNHPKANDRSRPRVRRQSRELCHNNRDLKSAGDPEDQRVLRSAPFQLSDCRFHHGIHVAAVVLRRDNGESQAIGAKSFALCFLEHPPKQDLPFSVTNRHTFSWQDGFSFERSRAFNNLGG